MKTVAALALACTALVTGGCSSSTQPGTASGCYPTRLRVSDAHVSAGDRLTVSSPPFRCQARYPAGKTYTLRLLQVGRAAPLQVAVVPVAQNGSLRATVRIPRRASPGLSYIEAHDSPFDQPCQDTVPAAASCAAYVVRVRVGPAPVEVRGRLRMTGGPSGASQPGVPGTVTFVDRATGHRSAATANADGSFAITVAPGRYTVTGTSPRFMDGQGSCSTAVPTAVPASGLTAVVVACSRK